MDKKKNNIALKIIAKPGWEWNQKEIGILIYYYLDDYYLYDEGSHEYCMETDWRLMKVISSKRQLRILQLRKYIKDVLKELDLNNKLSSLLKEDKELLDVNVLYR